MNFNKNKRAFTLIELLIVIAIIGILFIVLVSRVDFATDKAKATGVQTDFRAFQLAFETVAKENAGFNTFGWNTGDVNANGIRDSYDEGDTNYNGKEDAGEVFTGHKVYGENWSDVWTLVHPIESDNYSAFEALEKAINANLDPKLHITIANDGIITMANQARDPWKNEYHGQYITNASAIASSLYNQSGVTADGMDRGAIIIYSDGANGQHGTKAKIDDGIVTATVSLVDADTMDNNVKGKDDYVLAVFYTYSNGYWETATITQGFSNNQTFVGGNGTRNELAAEVTQVIGHGQYFHQLAPSDLVFRTFASIDDFVGVSINGEIIPETYYSVEDGIILTLKREYLETLEIGKCNISIILKDNVHTATFDIVTSEQSAQGGYYDQPYSGLVNMYDETYVFLFRNDGTLDFQNLLGYSEVCRYTYIGEKDILVINSFGNEYHGTFNDDYTEIYCYELETNFTLGDDSVIADNDYFYIYSQALGGYEVSVIDNSQAYYPDIKPNINGKPIVGIFRYGFQECYNLRELPNMPSSVKNIGVGAFYNCTSLETITLPSHITYVDEGAFAECNNLKWAFIESTNIYLNNSVFANISNNVKAYFAASENIKETFNSEWDYISWNRQVEAYWNWTKPSTTYTFEVNGGTLSENHITSNAVITLPRPTREGYIFAGWYENASYDGVALSGKYYNHQNTTLYAKWMSTSEYQDYMKGRDFENAIAITNSANVVIDEVGESVYFKFVPTTSGVYKIYSEGTYDTYGCVYNSDKMLMQHDDDGNDNLQFCITEIFTAGQTYYIEARMYSDDIDNFQLIIEAQ